MLEADSQLTGFGDITNLSATPGRAACPSRASGWSSAAVVALFLAEPSVIYLVVGAVFAYR
jgi:hypothetical protein